MIKLGRLGTTAEIAGLVSFFASKDSDYITGTRKTGLKIPLKDANVEFCECRTNVLQWRWHEYVISAGQISFAMWMKYLQTMSKITATLIIIQQTRRDLMMWGTLDGNSDDLWNILSECIVHKDFRYFPSCVGAYFDKAPHSSLLAIAEQHNLCKAA